MITDFREVQKGAVVDSDVCIIGAGAAGITMARALANSSLQVTLLESGRLEYDDRTQSLNGGRSDGLRYFPLISTRLRYFGGTTNHWNGWCAPLNDLDFAVRSWVPDSGWPIAAADLIPYYEAAQKICQLGPFQYDAAFWQTDDWPFPAFDPAKLKVRVWQFSPPTRFGEEYKAELERAVNVRVYLHATATELEAQASSPLLLGVKARSLDGAAATFKAKAFVLACGGIENARMLLVSDKVQAQGLGNAHGLVGRFFMEHPHVPAGELVVSEPGGLAARFGKFMRANTMLQAGLCVSPSVQERERILNCSTEIVAIRDETSGFEKLLAIRRALRDGKMPAQIGSKLWAILRDFNDVAWGLVEAARGRRYFADVSSLSLYVRSEQAPNPDSRITLSGEQDELGVRRVALDWQLTQLDRRTIRTAIRLIGEDVGRLGLGRVKMPDWLLSDHASLPETFQGGWHHMGTTRMSDNSKHGVVDSNCRVHQVRNLYVAGSSVFPTGGYASPTLTIVALALRLVNHLKTELIL